MDQETWIMEHGPGSVGSVFEMRLNCVLIVARLRQNKADYCDTQGVARCRINAFYAGFAIAGCREISVFMCHCVACLYTYVAGKAHIEKKLR